MYAQCVRMFGWAVVRKMREGKKNVAGEEGCSITDFMGGGKKTLFWFIHLFKAFNWACMQARTRTGAMRYVRFVEGISLDGWRWTWLPPLSSSGMLTSVEGTGRLWNNSMSRGTWLKDGEWVEMKEMNVKMRVLRDESTGCRYLIATPRRPLSLTPLSGSLYLVISFV